MNTTLTHKIHRIQIEKDTQEVPGAAVCNSVLRTMGVEHIEDQAAVAEAIVASEASPATGAVYLESMAGYIHQHLAKELGEGGFAQETLYRKSEFRPEAVNKVSGIEYVRAQGGNAPDANPTQYNLGKQLAFEQLEQSGMNIKKQGIALADLETCVSEANTFAVTPIWSGPLLPEGETPFADLVMLLGYDQDHAYIGIVGQNEEGIIPDIVPVPRESFNQALSIMGSYTGPDNSIEAIVYTLRDE